MAGKKQNAVSALLTRERVLTYLRSRYNPLLNLTAEQLKLQHAQFESGHVCYFAQTMEHMKAKDDVLAGVSRKRERAPGTRGYEILTTEDSDRAMRHKQVLEDLYNNCAVTNAVDENERGGVSRLLRQMMTAVSFRYARHNIVWLPGPAGITAEFRFVPLSFFENTTGQLRFLPYDGALYGTEPEPDQWLTTVGDMLMLPCSIAWWMKHQPLRDWMIYCARHVMPGFLGKTSASQGTPQWVAMEKAVADLSAEWAGVVGGSDSIETLDLGAKGELPYPKLIERCDRVMAALYRGADLSTMSAGSGDGTGASLQGEEAQILEAGDAEMLSEALQMYVDAPAIRFHFGDEQPLAYIQVRTSTRQNVEQDLAVDKGLHEMGYPTGLKQISQRYGRPLPEAGEEVLPPPAQAAGSMPVAGNEAAAETALAKAGEKLVADAVSRTLQVRQDYVEAFFARIEPLAAAGKLSDRELLDAIEEMAVNLPEVMGGKLPDDVAVIVEGLLGAGVASAIDANAKEPK